MTYTKKVCCNCEERKDLSEFMVSLHRDSANGRDNTIDCCRQCCVPPDILERITRWFAFATRHKYKIDYILIHPADAAAAPSSFEGLPVRVMGVRA